MLWVCVHFKCASPLSTLVIRLWFQLLRAVSTLITDFALRWVYGDWLIIDFQAASRVHCHEWIRKMARWLEDIQVEKYFERFNFRCFREASLMSTKIFIQNGKFHCHPSPPQNLSSKRSSITQIGFALFIWNFIPLDSHVTSRKFVYIIQFPLENRLKFMVLLIELNSFPFNNLTLVPR